MKQHKFLFLLFVACGIFPAASATAQTLGAVMKNAVTNSTDITILFVAFAYLAALLCAFWGIWKLKEHVENPSQTPIFDPMKRFLAGGMFFSLPFIYEVVKTTLNPDDVGIEATGGYNTSGGAGEGLDAMLVSFMKDIWDDFHILIIFFCYIAASILVLVGISRMLKSEQDGPKGPTGLGTIMTFLVAGVLFSVNPLLDMVQNTFFNSQITPNAALTYTTGLPDGGARANAVIGAIMAFIALVGWISFIRGFFIMRDVAEGGQQASVMAGLTHIFGGAIAVNLGAFVKAVQETLGITEYGLTISALDPTTLMPALSQSMTMLT